MSHTWRSEPTSVVYRATDMPPIRVETIGPMVSTLITGMSVALYTTLVGSLLNVWLMVNVRLLESGTVQLLTATIELGERHARP